MELFHLERVHPAAADDALAVVLAEAVGVLAADLLAVHRLPADVLAAVVPVAFHLLVGVLAIAASVDALAVELPAVHCLPVDDALAAFPVMYLLLADDVLAVVPAVYLAADEIGRAHV